MNRSSHNPRITVGSLTYDDYLLAAAREMGFASEDEDGKAKLPEDRAETAQLRRVVDRALREWAMSHPLGWRVLRRTARIRFLDGVSSYRMPRDFNGVSTSEWSVRGGYPDVVPVVSSSEFDAVSGLSGLVSGSSFLSSFRRVSAGDSEAVGGMFWLAEFTPDPPSGATASIGYEAWIEGMAHGSDVFQAGPPYDRSLEDMVSFVAAREARKPDDLVAARQAMMSVSLRAAIAFDTRSRPVFLGALEARDYDTMVVPPRGAALVL